MLSNILTGPYRIPENLGKFTRMIIRSNSKNFVNYEDVYEHVQIVHFIYCKYDKSILDNYEARSLVSLIVVKNT